jgi:hypothetical protein
MKATWLPHEKHGRLTIDDRALAFANIEKAAEYYNIDLSETSWHDLGVHPQPHREESPV